MSRPAGWQYPYAAGLGAIEPLTRLRSKVADVLVRLCARHRVRCVVDVGCGDGTLAALVARATAVRDVVLVEPDAGLLTVARRATACLAVRGDVDHLPLRAFPSPTLVIASHVLYYSVDWPRALSWLCELTANGSVLAVVVRGPRSASYRLRRAVVSAEGGDAARVTCAAHIREWLAEYGGRTVETASVVSTIRVELPGWNGEHAARRLCCDSRLRQLLTLLCHTDPMTSSVAEVLDVELSRMVAGSAVELMLEDAVLVC